MSENVRSVKIVSTTDAMRNATPYDPMRRRATPYDTLRQGCESPKRTHRHQLTVWSKRGLSRRRGGRWRRCWHRRHADQLRAGLGFDTESVELELGRVADGH